MEEHWKEYYNDVEGWHFWARTRRELIVKLMERNALLSPEMRVLDIGCSAGHLLDMLKGRGMPEVYGVDVSNAAIALAKERGLTNVLAIDGSTLPFPDAYFDVLIASDVLEHIEEPIKALKEWSRVLKPGGRLLVFVPAFQWMWTEHDKLNQHYRRYSIPLLKDHLQQGQLHTISTGFWNNMLLLPAMLMVFISKFFGRKVVERGYGAAYSPTLINGLMTLWLRTENALLLNGIKLPFGLSTYAIASKPA